MTFIDSEDNVDLVPLDDELDGVLWVTLAFVTISCTSSIKSVVFEDVELSCQRSIIGVHVVALDNCEKVTERPIREESEVGDIVGYAEADGVKVASHDELLGRSIPF